MGLPVTVRNAGDEREGVQRHRRGRYADKAQRAGGPQSLDVDIPVLIGVDGVQDEVERAGYFFHGLRLARMTKWWAPKRAGFFFFAGRGGEGGDFRAEDARELDGDVAEAADADDADAGGRIDAVVAQRIVDGDAAAEQRRGLFAGQRIGNGHDEAGVGANAVGIAAVAMNAGGFHRGAEILQCRGCTTRSRRRSWTASRGRRAGRP